jgi:type VI secretion system protein ImpM
MGIDLTQTTVAIVAPTPPAAEGGAREPAGWYGKIATLGDFAQRRLPPEFIAVSDAWMSRGMSACREQLGERWLDVYLTAPVMRFAWAPGVADANWWFGVLMPSCDNVGRYFPLLIARRRARPPQDRIALDHLEAWFDHAAAAATHTLAEQASIESFEEALNDAPPWPTPGTPTALSMHSTATCDRYDLGARATLNQWLHAVSIDELHARFSGKSIWWRQGDANHEGSASVVQGLPDPTTFVDLLSTR